jgi:serine/threonine protein kinase/Flp pilus assembly protein TadD
MASEVRQTVEDIFQTACELTLEERAAYLDRACAADEKLRREVEELLKFHEPDGAFLEKPALQDAARQMANRLTLSDAGRQTTPDTLREGGWMLGPYRILGQLGKGGMGVVYLAEDTRDEKLVAIKVLPKDFDLDEDRLARFSREGRMLEELKSLKHPNIAEIYEQTEYDGKPCIVLEYVPGDTLAERLRNGPLPAPEALQIGLQIADALQSAHQQRIVHRDLKPANIKITPEGQVKVLDFGLAKRFQPDFPDAETSGLQARSLSLTESGMLIGTPAYMSPEQWNGQTVDQRADLWAFGCLIYEMLSGRAPFAGATRAETMKRVFDASPDWQALPSDTPLVIQNMLLRCFQRDANQRLQNAGEARRAVAEAITANRFAVLLYLKTRFLKIDRRTKIVFTAVTLALLAFLALKYTSLGDLLLPPQKRISIVGKNDLAAILQEAIEKLTPDLTQAALMPDKPSSDELLQSERWKALMNSSDNRQVIEDVIGELKNVIKKDGESAKLYAILAQAYLFRFYLTKDTKDKDGALDTIRIAQSLNAESPDVLVVQGNVLISIAEYNKAVEVLEKARSQQPDEPEILLGLAMAHDFSGDEKDQAEGLYRAAIDARQKREGKPDWGDFNELGWYYFDQGRYEQAADCWREVIKLNPMSPTGYINLGNALLYLGCFNEAVDKYRDSIARGGENVEARVNLGAAYYYLGDYGNSINHLQYVTGKPEAGEDTNLTLAWGNLGDSYSQIGQPNEARNAYHTALKLADRFLMQLNNDPQVTALKAEILSKLNLLGQSDRRDDPVSLIEETLDSRLNCLECVAAATIVYHIARKDDLALQMATRAVDEGYSPFLLINDPQLIGLRNQAEFKRIEQIAQSRRGKCGDK